MGATAYKVRVVPGGTLKGVTFENQDGVSMARVTPNNKNWISHSIKDEEKEAIQALMFTIGDIVRPFIASGAVELVVTVPVQYDPTRERFRSVARML